MPWHAKPTGGYSMSSQNGYDNMAMIASQLMLDYGWTLEAVCGMLGNIAGEGGLNAWRWENDDIKSYSAAQTTSKGMGLIGWTPARKYCDPTNNYFPEWNLSSFRGYGPNFSDRAGNVNDGEAQTELIGKCMTGRGHRNFWILGRHDINGNYYNVRAEDYIRYTNVETAAVVWLWEAEYPSSIHPPHDPTNTENRRKGFARTAYQIMIDHGFQPTPSQGFPIPLLFANSVNWFRSVQ